MKKYNKQLLLGIGILIIILTLVLLINFTTGNLGSADESEMTYGEQLLSQRRYEEALGLYHNMVEKGNNLQLAYFGRGKALVGLRRFDEGIQDFTSSLNIQKSPEVLTARCNAFRLVGQIEESLADCTEALQLDSNFPDANLTLAILYLEENRIPEANDLIDEFINNHPDYAPAYFALSQIQLMKGSFEEAINSLSKAIVLDPAQPQFYWERGFLYYSNGMILEAKVDMEKLIEIADPETDGELLYQAGTLLNSFSGFQESNP